MRGADGWGYESPPDGGVAVDVERLITLCFTRVPRPNWRLQRLIVANAASIPEPQRVAWTKHQVNGFKDTDEFEKEVVRHVETTLARSMFNCDESAAYSATSLAFRDRLILEWNRTQQRQTFADSKRVYYLSLEFLMGRALDNAMLNIGLKDVAKCGLALHQEEIYECISLPFSHS